MYETAVDPYCYPGTAILKNIPGLRNQEAPERFEAVITAQRADEPLPSGRLSVGHYRTIHHHLFQDVYAWAGRFRTVRMAKGQNVFCCPEHIASEMRRLFAELRHRNFFRGLAADDFAAALSHFLADLNAIHPFREGNGRTQLTFAAYLAARAGHAMRLDRLRPEEFLAAMVRSFGGDEEALTAEISAMLS